MFYDRFYSLAKKEKTSVSAVGKELGISSGSITAWKKGTEPSAAMVSKIANYFNVTTDYLLGLSDTPNPQELVVPDILKNVPVAFYRGEFEDLTQQEVDALAVIAKTLKAQRKL